MKTVTMMIELSSRRPYHKRPPRRGRNSAKPWMEYKEICIQFVKNYYDWATLSLHNLTFEDAIELALDKSLWRLLVASGATHW